MCARLQALERAGIRFQRVERDEGKAVLGAHVDAAIAEHAALGVVDRLHVADETPRPLRRRTGGGEADLHFRHARPAIERNARRRLAVQQLVPGDGPVRPGRKAVDDDVRVDGRRRSLEVAVNRHGRALSVGDGLDQVARAERDVAAREDACCRRRERLRVDPDRAGRRQLDPVTRLQERQVGPLAYRQDAGVGLHRHDVAVVVPGREASRLVEHRKHASQRDLLEPLRARERQRAAALHEPNALAARFFVFLLTLRGAKHRHLLQRFERDDRHLRRAAAQGGTRGVEDDRQLGTGGAESGPRGIERNEASANHDDPVAGVHPVAAVHVEEEIDRLDDAVEVRPGHLQVAPRGRAVGEEHRLEPFPAQVAEAEVRRQPSSREQLHAEPDDAVDLCLQDAAREPVLRDAVAHHAARLFGRLEHGDAVAEEREVVCRGKAGGPRANDRNTVRASRRSGRARRMPGVHVPVGNGAFGQPVLRVRAHRLDAETLGEIALQRTDGDGGVDRAAAAGVLARGRAHASAYGGEGVRRAGNEVGLLVAAPRDELDVPPGVSGDGARGLALDLGLPVLQVGQADANGHPQLRVDGPRGQAGGWRAFASDLTAFRLKSSGEALSRPRLRLPGLLLTVARRGVGHQRREQACRSRRDLVDGAIEGSLVGPRRTGRAAQLAHELERRRADLVPGRRRLEVRERPDVAAHGHTMSRSPVRMWYP